MTHTKPITFVAGGTRGDVQPYVVLAHALRQQGIDAQVAASERWRALINSMDVPYRFLPADPVELLLEPRFHAALSVSHGIGSGIRATWQYLREMRPYVKRLLAEIPYLHAESRMIVAGVASQWVSHPQIGRSTPIVWGVFQPIAPTRDFASPMLNARVPRLFNRQSHKLMNRMMWLSWQMHGLGSGGGLARINQQPAFFAFSRQLVPPWSDMAHQHAITGWLGGSMVHAQASDTVQRFLEDPTPFVVATFGTPAINESPALFESVITACMQLGVRLLLQVPMHLASMSVPQEVLLVSDDLNHQQVFARASVVIHHGGAGTAHACLAAGVPMIIVPRGIDQFDWAKRVYNAQLTPAVISRHLVQSDLLVDALARVDADGRFRQRMRTVQLGELAVSGVADATSLIQRHL